MTKSRCDNLEMITHNRLAHDRVAYEYDRKHIEIYNQTEQQRLNDVLKHALSFIITGAEKKKVLDFGAGTGNLTMHLWRLGAEVVAADVSEKSLNLLKEKIGHSDRVSTIVLSGEDLSKISDNTFDMVATYSVLHHIPDYLAIIEELVRVVKPGGIVYLDHEVSPGYWYLDDSYNTYLKELGEAFLKDHLYELGMRSYEVNKSLRFLISYARSFLGLFKRKKDAAVYRDCGDIHVLQDDHIEWREIAEKLAPNCDIVAETDYLVCREHSENPTVWKKWQTECCDMRYMIARKKVTTLLG